MPREFVSERKVRENVLRAALSSLFGDDATCKRARKNEEHGWLVESASEFREDWLDVLTTASRNEDRLRQQGDSSKEKQAPQDRSKHQDDSRQLPPRSSSYQAPQTYSRHVAGSNGGGGVMVTPAGTSSKASRPRDTSGQAYIPAPILSQQSMAVYGTNPRYNDYPPRSSSFNQETGEDSSSNMATREDRHRDYIQKPSQFDDRVDVLPVRNSLVRAATEPYRQPRPVLEQSFDRTPSLGQNLNVAATDRHGKPVALRRPSRGNVDGPDDDDDDDNTVGHRHGPISATRRLGRDDDDGDDDDTIGHQRFQNITVSAKQRGRHDDDDEDDTTIGHAHVPARSAALSQLGRIHASTTKPGPRSVASTSSKSSSRRTGTSVSSGSTRGTSIGTMSERGTVISQLVARDRHMQPIPSRLKNERAPLPKDDDIEAYTDDSDDDPSTGRQMEDSRHINGKRNLEDTKRRFSRETGGEGVHIARANSGRERDPRHQNGYRR